jgi:hypothetical protein
VVIDRPLPAEVQLHVHGFIRGDVVIRPGSVEFGDVASGESVERSITIEYAGKRDWKLVDVRGESDLLAGSLKETQRADGRVSYLLSVRLKPDAPVGYFQDQLVLVTSDQRDMRIPLMVSGRVLGLVNVSPAVLTMGVVRSGETVSKRLVVRGQKPFRVVAVRCSDESFSFATSDEAKSIHLIPVTFTASPTPGSFKTEIQIETDLESGAAATCVATATVQ